MKRAPSPDPKSKRKIRRRILPPGERTPRDQRSVDRATLRVMGIRKTVEENIQGIQHRILTDPGLSMEEHAVLSVELDRLTKLRTKLDNDYGHWDAIDDNGYDRDDPDDFNYPPPSPPPPGGAALFV